MFGKSRDQNIKSYPNKNNANSQSDFGSKICSMDLSQFALAKKS